jgi:hypothetical protein
MPTINGKKIAELAKSVGWTVSGEDDETTMESNVCISEPPDRTILDSDRITNIECDVYAYLEEYPEEGGIPLSGTKKGDGFVLDSLSIADLAIFVGLGIGQFGGEVEVV